MKQPRGFTLVELMVVIVVIGVLSALIIGVNSQTYGTSAMNVADELVSQMELCKMRAVSTRRWHRCEVTPSTVAVMQWQSTGMASPALTPGGLWLVVQQLTIGTGVTVWGTTAAACAASPCAGAPTTQNTSLVFDVDFKPDGSSTGGTLFVTDPAQNKMYRVVIYTATGGSYARNSW
jgi:prepilin-type N-terminal cleavage/methylation domain-containing protein